MSRYISGSKSKASRAYQNAYLSSKPAATSARYDDETNIRAQALLEHQRIPFSPLPSSSADNASFPEEESPAGFSGFLEAAEGEGVLSFAERYVLEMRTLQRRFRMSDVALDAILKTNAALFSDYEIPRSLYLLQQLEAASSLVSQISYCCPDCGGQAFLDPQTFLCLNASCQYASRPCKQLNAGYAWLDLKSQLKQLCERHLVSMLAHVESSQAIPAGTSSDLVNSKRYLSLGDNPSTNGTFFCSLVMHSDAAQLTSSSFQRFHPVQFSVAELPPKLRMSLRCTLWAAVYIGLKAVHHSTLYANVERQLEELARTGIEVTDSNGRTRLVKPRFLIATADLVERAKLLNMQCFSAQYGCSFCKIKSTREAGAPCYAHTHILPLRSSQHFQCFFQRAAQMNDGETVLGFKAGTPPFRPLLSGLPYSFPLDPMHLVYQGVLKSLLATIQKRDAATRWTYMDDPTALAQVNQLIRAIRWPTTISRRLRPFDEFANWKAQEFRLFVYAFPVMLHHLNDDDALNALAIFCSAIMLLHQDILTDEDIDRAEELLEGFHASLGDTFSSKMLSYNAHGLCHLPQQARELGPLTSQSVFHFESHLGSIARMLTGSRGHLLQLPVKFGGFLATTAKPEATKVATADSAVSYFGKPARVSFDDDELALVSQALSLNHDNVKRLCGPRRARNGYVSYSSAAARRLVNTAEANVHYRESLGGKAFGIIKKFFIYRNVLFAVVNRFQTNGKNVRDHISSPSHKRLFLRTLYEERLWGEQYVEVAESQDIEIVKVKRFLAKWVLIPSFNDKQFAVVLPRTEVHD